MAQIVIGKDATKHLDGSVQKAAMNFLKKLTQDDTNPSLRVKPLATAVDKRVRTARVTDDYRAVLFKMDGPEEPIYLLHGIWPHDEGNAIAASVRAQVDPIHGMFSIVEVATEIAAGDAGFGEVPSSYVDHSKLSYSWLGSYGYTASNLQEYFGLPRDVANRAMTKQTGDDLFSYAEGCSGWIQAVLVSLAAVESKEEILEELGLQAPDVSVEPGVSVEPDATDTEAVEAIEVVEDIEPVEHVEVREPTDQELLEALQTPQARSQYAFVDGEDEMRAIIESGTFGEWRKFLHPQQRRYASMDTSGPFRLSGAAGTGKTVVLLHRANNLANDDPEAKIILTTFGRTLAEDLRDQLAFLAPSKTLVEMGEPGIHVAGVDALAHRAITNAQNRGNTLRLEKAMQEVLGEVRSNIASREGPSWGDAVAASGISLSPKGISLEKFLEEEYRDVILPNRIVDLRGYLRVRRPGRGVGLNRQQRMQVWKAVEQYRSDARITGGLTFPEVAAVAAGLMKLRIEEGDPYYADSVLVDEGQDLSAVQWQFLRGLVAEGENDMFIAEDAQQRIYGRQLVLSHYGIKITGRSRRLTLNYRTTAENLSRAVATLQGVEYVNLDGNTFSIDDFVYKSLRRGPAPRELDANNFEEAIEHVVNTVTEWLNEEDVEAESIGVLTRYKNQANQIAAELSANGIKAFVVNGKAKSAGVPVMTMHRAKGLEFSKVAIILKEDAEEGSLREPEEPHWASLQYVGMTRARDEVAVVKLP